MDVAVWFLLVFTTMSLSKSVLSSLSDWSLPAGHTLFSHILGIVFSFTWDFKYNLMVFVIRSWDFWKWRVETYLRNHTIFKLSLLGFFSRLLFCWLSELCYCRWLRLPYSRYATVWRPSVCLSVPWRRKTPPTEKPAVCPSYVVDVSRQQKRTLGSDAGKTRCRWLRGLRTQPAAMLRSVWRPIRTVICIRVIDSLPPAVIGMHAVIPPPTSWKCRLRCFLFPRLR